MADPGDDLARKYVTVPGESRVGRYLELLHANFLRRESDRRDRIVRAVCADAAAISDDELRFLLDGDPDWRPRLVAAYLIAIGRRAAHRKRIGELLLESALTYAGQGYCVALAALGTAEDAAILAAYLDRYLPRADLRYDQTWAVAALSHVDEQVAGRYLAPGGLWEEWTATFGARPPDYQRYRVTIAEICSLSAA